MGEKVVDALEGRLDSDLKRLWSWSATTTNSTDENGVVWTEDGSRSGPRGMILEKEMARTKKPSVESKL